MLHLQLHLTQKVSPNTCQNRCGRRGIHATPYADRCAFLHIVVHYVLLFL